MDSKTSMFTLGFLILSFFFKGFHFQHPGEHNRLAEIESDLISKGFEIIMKKVESLFRHQKRLSALERQARMDLENSESFPAIDAYQLRKRIREERNILGIQDQEEFSDAELVIEQEEKEFNTSMRNLIRLQKVYILPIKDLVDGKIVIKNPQTGANLSFVSRPLNANDCYRIARHAYYIGIYESAIIWAEQSVRLFDKGDESIDEHDRMFDELPKDLPAGDFKGWLKFSILELFTYSLLQEGFFGEADATMTKIMKILQDSEEKDRVEAEYEEAAIEQAYQGENRIRPDDYGHQNKRWNSTEGLNDANSMRIYEALCRGEIYQSVADSSRLKCFYLNTSQVMNGYYKLWKIKVEEAAKDPHLLVFHDVITGGEIWQLKHFGATRLNPARLIRDIKIETRFSEAAWAEDGEGLLFLRLSERIEAITGLDVLKGSESLQIGSYGLGGFYYPHFDHIDDRKDQSEMFPGLGLGNRIATWMFYLSDVPAGGATVFPSAGVTLWPRKGSAAFWFNLKSSGHGDPMVLHAGCPVLVGNKWVANKWIHERNQEFRRPCHKESHRSMFLEKDYH